MSVENALKNAAASIEIEGYSVDEQYKEWCSLLLNNKITFEEYTELVRQKIGI